MNAVIYARYSSHGQTEQSIEGQLKDGYEWAARQGVTVIGEYIDRALTGTKDQRPDFQRMISDAAKKQFDIVIVWKLDRFARNRYDSAIYKARLKKYGVKVVSVKENITDAPEGIILEGLLESMAEYYSANLSQNVKRGIRETVSKGRFCGGPVPYGYRAVDGRLVPDEKTAPIVRCVFEQYAQGVPKKDIIDELNRRGIRNRAGKPLSYTAFQDVLRSTTYIGEHRYDGQVITGCADPIIPRDVFDKVQARLDRNVRAPAAGKAREKYLLSGKLFCGLCGSPMFGESGKSRNGKLHTYYACYARKRLRSCAKCAERRDELESFIISQTMEYILTPGRVSEIAAAVVLEYDDEFSTARVTDIEKLIARIDADIEKLVDTLTDCPKAARPRIYERMEQLENQKSELQADAAKLRVASGLRLTEKEVISWLNTFRDGDPTDPDFRARLIDTFINAVYIYDDRIVVFYNIRGGKQVSPRDLFSALAPAVLDSDSPNNIPDSAAPVSDSPDNIPGSAAPDPDNICDNIPDNTKIPNPKTCSDLEVSGGPYNSKSEPHYIFIDGMFGCIYNR